MTTIVIMGPCRSGTSLIARILWELGVDFGDFSTMQPPPDRYNPGGYFQHPDVIAVNRRLIKAGGGTEESLPEPELIRDNSEENAFESCRSLLAQRGPVQGVKDPRFCATLLTWSRRRVFPDDDLRIVRVSRDLDKVAASAVRHREVGSFCGFDVRRARTMAERYDQFAIWHCETMSQPVCHVEYEEVIKDPQRVVRDLGALLGIAESGRIRSAEKLVGKRRAQVRYYLYKARHPNLVWATTKKTILATIESSRRRIRGGHD